MVILTRLSAGIEADNVVCFITYRHVVEVYCNDDEMAKLLREETHSNSGYTTHPTNHQKCY